MKPARVAVVPRAPSLEAFERDVKGIGRDLAQLRERWLVLQRVVESCDAGEDVFDPARVEAAREMRRIRRALLRAQCELVLPGDKRFAGARQVHADLAADEQLDGPWSDHRTPVAGVAA